MRAITGIGAEGLTDTAESITGALFSNYAVKVGGFVGATEISAVYACANTFDSSRVSPPAPSPPPAHLAASGRVPWPPGLSEIAQVENHGHTDMSRSKFCPGVLTPNPSEIKVHKIFT